MKTWPNTSPGATFDVIEFVMPPKKEDGYNRRYRVNVSFMMSNWHCIFGQGCPGVLISSANDDAGCCQIGVHLERKEIAKLSELVRQMGPEDVDNYEDIQRNGWKYKVKDEGERDSGYTYHTRVVEGACVLANRAGGKTGKVGCSLHAFALKTGQDPNDTKPNICWQVPIGVVLSTDEEEEEEVIEIGPTTGKRWGSNDPNAVGFPGWFCTETPEAFSSDEILYRREESSLRRQMGNDAYDEMCRLLEAIDGASPMPGEEVNEGRPLIPLMVLNRKKIWEEQAASEDEAEQKEGKEALRLSQAYFEKYNVE